MTSARARSPARGIHVGGVAYALGQICAIGDIVDDEDARQAMELLAAVGVPSYSRLERPPLELIIECAARSLVLSGLNAERIDTVIVVTETFTALQDGAPRRGETEFWAARNRLLDAFGALGVSGAKYLSTAFGGSTNFAQAVYVAASLLDSDRARTILLACADRHPDGVTRFMHDSVAITGDGVATCVLGQLPFEGSGPAFNVEHVGITPYLVPPATKPFAERVLDMYRATKVAAAECYEATGRQPPAYDHLVLNNYNRLTSEVFSRLLGIDYRRTYGNNVGRTGHLPSCDTLVNLADLFVAGTRHPRQTVMVFLNGPASCAAMSLTTDRLPHVRR